jgi:hypothetical protein
MKLFEMIQYDNNDFIELHFDYNHDFLIAFKKLVPSYARSYHPDDNNMWTVQNKYGDQIADIAREHFKRCIWHKIDENNNETIIDLKTGKKIIQGDLFSL